MTRPSDDASLHFASAERVRLAAYGAAAATDFSPSHWRGIRGIASPLRGPGRQRAPHRTAQHTRRPPHGSLPHKVDLGRRFDKFFAVISVWLLAGLILDGWAHYHVAKLETFFTPW